MKQNKIRDNSLISFYVSNTQFITYFITTAVTFSIPVIFRNTVERILANLLRMHCLHQDVQDYPRENLCALSEETILPAKCFVPGWDRNITNIVFMDKYRRSLPIHFITCLMIVIMKLGRQRIVRRLKNFFQFFYHVFYELFIQIL